MARKKEADLEIKNKERISQVASELFLEKGIDGTTMNDIAKEAQISKSTLYVYFKCKDDVMNYLSLGAMKYFYETLREKLKKEDMEMEERYFTICNVLVKFKQEFPLHFELLVKEICVEDEVLSTDPVLKEVYETGEAVNQLLFQAVGTKILVKDEKEMFLKIFSLWGSMYGIITLADNKEKYIAKASGMTKEEFINKSFLELYRTLKWRKEDL